MQLFRKNFQGQFVEIVADMEIRDEEGSKMPLVTKGYIVDCDDKFIYLGSTPIEIDSCIKFDDLKFCTISDPDDFEEVLSPGPESDTDLN